MDEIKETQFRLAWKALRDQIEVLTGLMDDPFKAPELTVAEMPSLLSKLWTFQLEWASLTRSALADDYAIEILKEARRQVGLATNEGMAEAGRILDALVVRTERGEDYV